MYSCASRAAFSRLSSLLVYLIRSAETGPTSRRTPAAPQTTWRVHLSILFVSHRTRSSSHLKRTFPPCVLFDTLSGHSVHTSACHRGSPERGLLHTPLCFKSLHPLSLSPFSGTGPRRQWTPAVAQTIWPVCGSAICLSPGPLISVVIPQLLLHRTPSVNCDTFFFAGNFL